jgi:hypothetical protein
MTAKKESWNEKPVYRDDFVYKPVASRRCEECSVYPSASNFLKGVVGEGDFFREQGATKE